MNPHPHMKEEFKQFRSEQELYYPRLEDTVLRYVWNGWDLLKSPQQYDECLGVQLPKNVANPIDTIVTTLKSLPTMIFLKSRFSGNDKAIALVLWTLVTPILLEATHE